MNGLHRNLALAGEADGAQIEMKTRRARARSAADRSTDDDVDPAGPEPAAVSAGHTRSLDPPSGAPPIIAVQRQPRRVSFNQRE